MGDCGCNDFNAKYQFPGPEGITYAFEVHMGCSNCGTPVGVIIYRFGENGAKTWCEGLPELPIRTHSQRGDEVPHPDDVDGEFMQHILDPAILIEGLQEHFGAATLIEESEDDEEGDELSVRDLLEDEGDDVIGDAIEATLDRFAAAQRSGDPEPDK